MRITIGKTVYLMNKFTPRTALKACELSDRATKASDLREEMDLSVEIVSFIANDVFGGQFTVDDFMDNYQTTHFTADLFTMLAAVRGVLSDKLAEFPSTDDEAKNVSRGSAEQKK